MVALEGIARPLESSVALGEHAQLDQSFLGRAAGLGAAEAKELAGGALAKLAWLAASSR
jgi:hypothetical protein